MKSEQVAVEGAWEKSKTFGSALLYSLGVAGSDAWRWRVRRRRMHRWWQEFRVWPALLSHRSLILLAAGLLPLVILWANVRNGYTLSGYFEAITGAALKGDLGWKEVVQPLFVLMTAPVLFLLWWFRDQNEREKIETHRKDINLKDFQEVQRRAAGLIEGKAEQSQEALTLQITALYQLVPFLKGEYGDSFRRPAFETYRALLKRYGEEAYQKAEEALKTLNKAKFIFSYHREYREILKSVNIPQIYKTLLEIVAENPRAFFNKDFPLQGLLLPFAKLDGVDLAELDLSRIDLRGTHLSRAYLEGANLGEAHLDGANLTFAHLEGAGMDLVRLEGASLAGAHLERAYLSEAYLRGANLRGAHLKEADLSYSDLAITDLREVHAQKTSFVQANLAHAALRLAYLKKANLEKALLTGANLRNAHLEEVNLSEAQLEGAYLYGIHLEEMDSSRTIYNESSPFRVGAQFKDAVYDDQTQFGYLSKDGRAERADEHREALRALGLRHVDEVE